VIASILSYGLGNLDTGLKVNEKESTEMDFWRRAAGTSRLLKVRNEAIKEKVGVTIFGEMEHSLLKWYGHIVHMEDKRLPM